MSGTLEHELTSHLTESADPGTHEGIEAVLAITSQSRRSPGWLAMLKEPPMRSHSSVVVGSSTLRLASVVIATVGLITALAGAAIASGVASPPAHRPAPAYGPAANGPLAYSTGRDIHLVDPDGDDDRAIIDDPSVDVAPWFSHDGEHLFFVRDPDIAPKLMVANPDGTGVHKVLEPAPDWFDDLPDGHSLVAATGDPLRLHVFDIDTGATLRDLDLQGAEPTGWVVARPPDGHELILTAHPTPGEPDQAFYAYDLATDTLRMIGQPTTGESPAADEPPPDVNHVQWSFQDASLAPDGSTVAYWNWETPPDLKTAGPYSYVMNLDTGEQEPMPLLGDRHTGLQIMFAPDGDTVLFRRDVGGYSHILVGPRDGSSAPVAVGISYPYQSSRGVDISPDGRSVLQTTRDPAATVITDIATGGQVQLADGSPDMPSWQRLAP